MSEPLKLGKPMGNDVDKLETCIVYKIRELNMFLLKIKSKIQCVYYRCFYCRFCAFYWGRNEI